MTQNPRWGGQGLPGGFALGFSEMLISGNMAGRCTRADRECAHTIEAHATRTSSRATCRRWSPGTGPARFVSPSLTAAGSRAAAHAGRAARRRNLRDHRTKTSSAAASTTCRATSCTCARGLVDAPAGTRRHQPVPGAERSGCQREPGRANGVACGSIEHKMGIHASPTCVMHFNDATGWLVGQANGGLACMFTMMNHARLGVGLQGQGVSELAWQASVAYARERRQGRSLSAARPSGAAADPIIVHPDVRRMLLTQKAFVEGGRLLAFLTGREMDSAELNPDAESRRRSEELIAFLTPIVKAFLTDGGGRVAVSRYRSTAPRLHPARPVSSSCCARADTPIYEGTNGIQALDLLGRKVFGHGRQEPAGNGGAHPGVDRAFRRNPGARGLCRRSRATSRPLGSLTECWPSRRRRTPMRSAPRGRLPAVLGLSLPRLVLAGGRGCRRAPHSAGRVGCALLPRQARHGAALLRTAAAARRSARGGGAGWRRGADGAARRTLRHHMSDAAARGAERLRSARRVVVKVGSALLVDAATGRLNRDWLAALAEDLADLRRQGTEPVVVSSGAIALGRGPLQLGAGRFAARESQAARPWDRSSWRMPGHRCSRSRGSRSHRCLTLVP